MHEHRLDIAVCRLEILLVTVVRLKRILPVSEEVECVDKNELRIGGQRSGIHFGDFAVRLVGSPAVDVVRGFFRVVYKVNGKSVGHEGVVQGADVIRAEAIVLLHPD